MAVSHIAAIESVLQQMRAVAGLAHDASAPAAAQPSPSGASFAAVLRDSLHGVAQMQNDASQQAKALMAGEPGVALNDVMLDLQKANIAFQTTLQVRNRLVAAYQEVANMTV